MDLNIGHNINLNWIKVCYDIDAHPMETVCHNPESFTRGRSHEKIIWYALIRR